MELFISTVLGEQAENDPLAKALFDVGPRGICFLHGSHDHD